MAQKKRSATSKKIKYNHELSFDFLSSSVLQDRSKIVSQSDLPDSYAKLLILGPGEKKKLTQLVSKLAPWQSSQILNSIDATIKFSGTMGPVTVLICDHLSEIESEHQGRLNQGLYGAVRELAGGWWSEVYEDWSDKVIEFLGEDRSVRHGAFVGCGISDYKYSTAVQKTDSVLWVATNKKQLVRKDLDAAHAVASSVNLARHLVNIPPNFLNPTSYSESMEQIFSKRKYVTVDTWKIDKLKKEKMGCLIGVGQGASHPPRFVHIKYRPPGKKKSIAFVGKGITFDSGGLDLKLSGGMRLMKKDMGGSASVMGLANWVTMVGSSQPCDFYIALAENAVSANAFRPSDVLRSRKGLSVEIDNTDAEGRLVLADALDVAVTYEDRPKAIIDVATLTGAIKVGLGSEISGFFSNDDKLSEKIEAAWSQRDELVWRMPLYRKALKKLKSPFADLANSAKGFGGAIRAAVFLEQFVDPKIPWAHFDIFAWNDSVEGSLSEEGGSGQAVQGLIELVEKGV